MKWLVVIAIGAGVVFALPTIVHEVSVITHAEAKPITILAFGDLMLDRTVRTQIEAYGPMYPFEKIAPLIAGHDLVVANAEGVFTNHSSLSQLDHSILRFTFATSTLPILRQLGFTHLSQANNHALDFGGESLAYSKSIISAQGMVPFGDSLNTNPTPVYAQVRGETIAFVGYHQLFDPDDAEVVWAIVEAKSKGAFVMVYPHWGEEYNVGTTSAQTRLAHRFIDAGADVVLGAHPHVVEPVEVYNGKAIFYSLGNFIFDQKWNGDVSHGLAVELSLLPSAVTYTLIPFAIVEGQAVPEDATFRNSFTLTR